MLIADMILLSENEKYEASIMLKNQTSAQPIPDPWSNPSRVQQRNPIPETWHLPTEPYPLISPAGNQSAPRLVNHQSTSEEILLEDQLKLTLSADSFFKQKLEKALTLLYWLETIG